jgi:hypothetical protein
MKKWPLMFRCVEDFSGLSSSNSTYFSPVKLTEISKTFRTNYDEVKSSDLINRETS